MSLVLLLHRSERRRSPPKPWFQGRGADGRFLTFWFPRGAWSGFEFSFSFFLLPIPL